MRLLVAAWLITGFAGHAFAQTPPPAANVQPPAPAQASTSADSGPQTPGPRKPGPQNEARPQKYVIPAGAKVLLSLKSGINTKTAHPGDSVYLESDFPVVIDGHVLIPSGAYVQGVIDRVVRPGRIRGRAKVGMHFTSIIFPDGHVAPIPGMVNSLPGSPGPNVEGSEGTIEQQGQTGRDAGQVAKGAASGATAGAIGGLVGGNAVAGLGYGAAAGAAVGLVYTLFTRGDDINIPSGASIEMVLQRPMSLEAQQYATAAAGDMQRPSQQYVPVDQQAPLPKPQQPEQPQQPEGSQPQQPQQPE